MKTLKKRTKKKIEELSIEDFFKECITMATNQRNVIEVELNGYIGRTYEDYFLGEWVGNFEIIKDNKVIFHTTLNKVLKNEEECMKMLESGVKICNLVKEKKFLKENEGENDEKKN